MDLAFWVSRQERFSDTACGVLSMEYLWSLIFGPTFLAWTMSRDTWFLRATTKQRLIQFLIGGCRDG